MGTYFEWNDSCRVDGGPIDEEHKRLLGLADEALQAVGPPLAAERLKETVKLLFKYMETHFENEERFMRAVHFEELEQHCEMHRTLARNLKSLLTSAKSLQELGDALPYLVVEWVTQHVLVEDQKIARHIEECGHAVATATVTPALEAAPADLAAPAGV